MKKEAYLAGYRRGYAYTAMYNEDIPSHGDGVFTDWLFDLPGQNHPIEYLELSEVVHGIVQRPELVINAVELGVAGDMI